MTVEVFLRVSDVTGEGLCGCAGEKNDPHPRRGEAFLISEQLPVISYQ